MRQLINFPKVNHILCMEIISPCTNIIVLSTLDIKSHQTDSYTCTVFSVTAAGHSIEYYV